MSSQEETVMHGVRTITITLTVDEAHILRESLEEAEYWAHGTHGDPGLPVNNGHVWLPGDVGGGDGEEPDRYWPEPPNSEEEDAIRYVRSMRAVGSRLHRALRDV